MDRPAGRVPASWTIVERLRVDHAGLLMPSFAPEATAAHVNLVLGRWNDDQDRIVKTCDPGGRLPRDQSSWWQGPYGDRPTVPSWGPPTRS